MPVSVRERSERRTRTLRVSYLVVSLGCAALLAVVCRLGVRLAGTVSVSAAWEQFTARVASDPRFQVVVSALQEGGSARFHQAAAVRSGGRCRRGWPGDAAAAG